MNSAIYFHSEGYLTTGEKLMGRHSAGAGFLRGLASTTPAGDIWALVPSRSHDRPLREALAQAGHTGSVHAILPSRLGELVRPGCLYLPGPGIGEHAWRRLPHGERSWSLCGVTHTTASHSAMGAITDLLSAPLHPWDAMVCTSRAVQQSVRLLLERQADYLRWRLGATRFELPQLPLIPLGVSCDEFSFTPDTRAAARARLNAGKEDVVLLFVGRLSFHAKAHPMPMLLAAEQAALARPDRRVHLVQCGWFANEAIRAAFDEAQQKLAPSVIHHDLDGRDGEARRQAWAGADIFVSLSDNIQETFGLTPIEAMAAGLPVLVSDWDGYRDTVREGIDGFRIPTLMPPAPAGADLARRYDDGSDSYDLYCGQSCELTAADTGAATRALLTLAGDADLRRRMGDAGRRRAREIYDWHTIVARYRDLWGELADRRRGSPDFSGPPPDTERPDRMDPFALFAGYPSHLLREEDQVSIVPGAHHELLAALRNLRINHFANSLYPEAAECCQVLDALGTVPVLSVRDLLADFPAARRPILFRGLAWMMKMNVLRIRPAAGELTPLENLG